jgi:hypothetical protein
VVVKNKQEFSRAKLMANLKNFATDVQSVSDSYTKFTVSRILADKQDELLDIEIPAEFSDALLENNIELHLYSLADNSLIYSQVIPNSTQAISVKTLQYDDGSFRKLLFLDFSKINAIDIPVGEYSITLNFFADEVGSSENRVLKVTNISTSRTEVELKLTDEKLQPIIENFAIPRIPVDFIVPVLQQLFNQSGSVALTPPTSPVAITSESIYTNFSNNFGEQLIQYGFDQDDEDKIGINTIIQNVLDDAYPIAINLIEEKIMSGSKSFTETELVEYVTQALDEAYEVVFQDELQNPQTYRFDLV